MLEVVTTGNETTRYYNIEGVLDISTSELFADKVLKKANADEIILNLSKLTFIDSTGIGVILELIYQLKENNSSMQIAGMNEEVRDIFETIGVMRVMEALQRGGNECQTKKES